MASGCSIRAIWILNNLEALVFSRRFPVVDKRRQAACKTENQSCREEEEEKDQVAYTAFSLFPTDSELAASFVERKHRRICARIWHALSEQGLDKQGLMFSPSLSNFVWMRYQVHLMEGYKAPLTMEFCTVTMPFPRSRIVSLDWTAFLTADHSVEWKIVTTGRGLTGKSIELKFPGTVKSPPWQNQRISSSRSSFEISSDEDSDNEAENAGNMINEEHMMEKINKDLLELI